jgi:hypothetical protein
MLGIIEIKGETPTWDGLGGFSYIKFKIENKEDLDVLFEIFYLHMNDCFSGLSEEPEALFEDGIILNKEQTMYYDYQTNEITIR